MSSDNKKKDISRRDFINKGVRVSGAIGLGALCGGLIWRAYSESTVWQLDTKKCTQCGRCATSCIKSPSAVKCFHVYDMCGYCDLCGGYFRPEVKDLNTAAENLLCPTSAITRNFIEEPFFEYHIIEDLCIGCGKCVAGCEAFGNGSLQLQVSHNLCDNCNECSVARDCPSNAFSRVSTSEAYKLAGYKTGSNKSWKVKG